MRALIVIGGAIAGYLVLSRLSSASAAVPSSAPVRTTADGFWTPNLPIPGFSQAAAVLKPIADNVTTPFIKKLNSSVGGVDPYAPPKAVTNPDGSVTVFEQGGAIEITHYPDGHETHTVHYGVNPKVKAAGKAVWGAVSGGASAVKTVALAPVHFVEGLW